MELCQPNFKRNKKYLSNYIMKFGNKLGIPPNRFGNKLGYAPLTLGNKRSMKTQVVGNDNYNFTDKPKQSDLEKVSHPEALRQTHRMQG